MEFKTKKELRDRILTLLRTQKEDERLTKSLVICDKLFQMLEFQQSQVIFCYVSFDGEVDTFELMKKAQQKGKKIALPKISEQAKTMLPILVDNLEHDLQRGPYGIMQPNGSGENILDRDMLDMVIVPGVVFDRKNNRLGRGAGFYDRFLSKLSPKTPTVGLAYDFQIVDCIPQLSPHDVPVSHIITN